MGSDDMNKMTTPGRLRQEFSAGIEVEKLNAQTPPIEGRVLASAGDLEVRLAQSDSEIRASQALRYRVFYKEMSATPSADMAAVERDFDAFDDVTDHLLVIDRSRTGDDAVVGTYRLLRQEVAMRNDGFYSVSEFDISHLLENGLGRAEERTTQFLELGRSCVRDGYRNNATIQLLWRGISDYVVYHKVGCMFGCASLEGTDPDALAVPLSFLHHNFMPEPRWMVRALDEHYVDMNRIPADELDMKAALRGLAPLIKGYLRLGAFIGDGAVVDHQFGTTDVAIILPVERISDRYVKRYDK